MIPSTMTAIEIEGGAGSSNALRPAILPVPPVPEGEVLVKVAAAGVNRPDIFQRMGFYPPPPGAPDTLGLEMAGEVVVAGGRWRMGDRVCGLLGGGGYAEYVACDARHLLPVPSGLTLVEAASLPETVFTVFANLFEGGGLVAGETVLIHGATSGIGITAIQMAKAAGATVIGTVRGGEKVAAARRIGADLVIDTQVDGFAAAVERAGGADVVLDMVGASYLAENLAALKFRGRLVFIAALGGNEATLPIMAVMQKQLMLTGSTLRNRTADEKARLAAEIESVVWPWIDSGHLRPVIDATFPLADASEAHGLLERGAHVGKVVLVSSGTEAISPVLPSPDQSTA